MTFYAAVGLVPLLLLALFLAGAAAGPDMVQDLADGLTGAAPGRARGPGGRPLPGVSGTSMSPLAALAALVPASLYGEGLVRAFDRFSERERPARSAARAHRARSSSSP